jgi:hypothetical protein
VLLGEDLELGPADLLEEDPSPLRPGRAVIGRTGEGEAGGGPPRRPNFLNPNLAAKSRPEQQALVGTAKAQKIASPIKAGQSAHAGGGLLPLHQLDLSPDDSGRLMHLSDRSRWFAANFINCSATVGSVQVLASLMHRSAICR